MGTQTTLRAAVYWCAVAMASLCHGVNSPAQPGAAGLRPNIVFICTDQQRIDAMSVAGNRDLKTPGCDALAARGVRFTKSYCTFPLCSPSRASLVTSRMPYEVGVNWNNQGVTKGAPTLGTLFKAAGYRTVWSGKWHLPTIFPQAEKEEVPGFEVITPQGVSLAAGVNRKGKPGVKRKAAVEASVEADPGATDAAVLFLRENPKQPFLLVVSLLGPHDICGFKGEPRPGVHIPTELSKLPPLPGNLQAPDIEMQGVPLLPKGAGQQGGLGWSELGWRQQLYDYYRLAEQVDRSIEAIVGELSATGLETNTIVVLTSDHGEMAGSHRRIRKCCFYEEAMKVPFLMAGPGIPSKVDSNHLVSGLDVLPTLCDFAGIKVPAEARGMSVRPILSNAGAKWREAVFGALGSGTGRMVRSKQYKYAVYAGGKEELFDLESDPGETKNLAKNPEKSAVLEEHRAVLGEWMKKTGDKFGGQ